MIPQVVTNETVTVISPNGVNFPQTDKPQPTHQLQDNLKKFLKAEIKVIAVNQTQDALEWVEGKEGNTVSEDWKQMWGMDSLQF